jgi:hypothetical protein
LLQAAVVHLEPGILLEELVVEEVEIMAEVVGQESQILEAEAAEDGAVAVPADQEELLLLI